MILRGSLVFGLFGIVIWLLINSFQLGLIRCLGPLGLLFVLPFLGVFGGFEGGRNGGAIMIAGGLGSAFLAFWTHGLIFGGPLTGDYIPYLLLLLLPSFIFVAGGVLAIREGRSRSVAQ